MGCGLLLTGTPVVAPAQGFAVSEHGTCTMGRAGAGVAAPCDDGSAIFFNPAGLFTGSRYTVSAGVTGILALSQFTDDFTDRETELDESVRPVPHGFFVRRITERLAAGLGVFIPYELQTEWPLEFEGRFAGFDNRLRSVYIQPTASFRLHDRITVGAGLDIVVGSVQLNQRLDLAEQPAPPPAPLGTSLGELGIPPGTDFATAELEADGATGIGANFGVLVTITDWLSFGGRYLSRVTLDYDGEAEFAPVSTGIILPADNPFGVPAGTPLDTVLAGLGLFDAGGPLVEQGVRTSITMPDQLVVGFGLRARDNLLVLADYQYMNWSVFDRLDIEFSGGGPDREIIENYGDTHAVRLGADWRVTDRWQLRGGYLYHTAAAPDETVTPLLPEARRHEWTAGFGFRLAPGVRTDVAYQFLVQEDRRGRVREPISGVVPTTALNNGLYESVAHLGAVTVTVHF